ncbi:P-loop containing nucleoside triphosphate hydrolase protein, partial [Dichotomocladium elegans]
MTQPLNLAAGTRRKDHPTCPTQPSVAEVVHAKLTNYQEPPHLASLTSEQVALMLKAHEIQVKGSGVPHPITNFDECRSVLSESLLDNLDQAGWACATAVQRLTVPTMLAGRDVFVVAPSGSGKTVAFAVPIITHCLSLSASHQHKRRAGPYALVLAPTRDLCLQIESTLKRLARGLHNTRTALLVGGESMPLADQLYRLRKGVQIVVGTPGRVAMIASGYPHMLRIWRMRMVVLDEADVLFAHQGLRKQVKEILDRHLPDRHRMRRQTAYFSTTTDAQHILKKACRRLVQPVDI